MESIFMVGIKNCLICTSAGMLFGAAAVAVIALAPAVSAVALPIFALKALPKAIK